LETCIALHPYFSLLQGFGIVMSIIRYFCTRNIVKVMSYPLGQIVLYVIIPVSCVKLFGYCPSNDLEIFFRVIVYIQQPDTTYNTVRQILSPFTSGLWGTILLTLSVLTLIQSAVFNIGVHYDFQQGRDNYRLLNSCLYMFGVFCQQGEFTCPHS